MSAQPVVEYFKDLQGRICEALGALESQSQFVADPESHPSGGLSYPMLIADGEVLEKAAVNFSHSIGAQLPSAATEKRPEFAGCGFEATAISMIVHPVNPYAPTMHMNLRMFLVNRDGVALDWWFGGGFDLTPVYGFEEDAIHWHRTAKSACDPFGPEIYSELKAWCDRYFYLPHRKEARGIGGLFFDDWKRGGFEQSFAFVKSVGDHLLPGYMPILERRKDMAYGTREREFQVMRRGRYVEFNLVYDRGTRYGIQSGRRTETVMASMPAVASWKYKWTPEPGSPEEALYTDFLPARDWLTD